LKVLVVGGGGREHTLVWKISQSPKVTKIYCAPGNGGISKLAECVEIKATDISSLVEFAREKEIDLVVVGPDDPLAMGLVDELHKEGIRAFGPSKLAAEIEASKVFSKNLMKKYNIPTARYEVFENADKAKKYLEKVEFPIVIKAEGLALGKGVIIAENLEQAAEAIEDMMENKIFGESGSRVVIEEFLVGQEVTMLTFTDGKTIVPMVSSQDHKRIYDNDKGPNTGGMGAFSPSRIYTNQVAEICMEKIFVPTIKAMQNEGRIFKGILYFGLILTKDGPKVIEYNARFGDPETQVVIPRLKTDIIEIFNTIIDDRLEELNIEWHDGAVACVVMASGGYPGKYINGFEIKGIDEAEKLGCMVFHAGTKHNDGKIVTAGGRVLGVTAIGKDLDESIRKAYEGVAKIEFEDAQYRKDIGIKFIT